MTTPQPTSTAATPDAALTLTVFAVELSMCTPDPDLGDQAYSPLMARPARVAPVLHVLGRSASGQSTCVNVHGVLPYFLVPRYTASMTAVTFAAMLEQTAVQALQLGQGPADRQRLIHHVEAVQATPFYGFTPEPRPFFKVFVYHPWMVRRLANLLGSTRLVGGRRWQPYEAHLPYPFQFMLDHGLCGMGTAEVTAATVRSPLPARHEEVSFGRRVRATSRRYLVLEGRPLPSGLAMGDVDLTKLSVAPVEVDCRVEHFQPHPVGPGASLEFVRRQLRRYLESIGEDPALLDAAGALDPTLTRPSVAKVQRDDAMAGVMRRRAADIAAGNVEDPTAGDGTGDRCVAPTPDPAVLAALPSANDRLHSLLAPRGGAPDVTTAADDGADALHFPSLGHCSAEFPDGDADDAALEMCPTFALLGAVQRADAPCGLGLSQDGSDSDGDPPTSSAEGKRPRGDEELDDGEDAADAAGSEATQRPPPGTVQPTQIVFDDAVLGRALSMQGLCCSVPGTASLSLPSLTHPSLSLDAPLSPGGATACRDPSTDQPPATPPAPSALAAALLPGMAPRSAMKSGRGRGRGSVRFDLPARQAVDLSPEICGSLSPNTVTPAAPPSSDPDMPPPCEEEPDRRSPPGVQAAAAPREEVVVESSDEDAPAEPTALSIDSAPSVEIMSPAVPAAPAAPQPFDVDATPASCAPSAAPETAGFEPTAVIDRLRRDAVVVSSTESPAAHVVSSGTTPGCSQRVHLPPPASRAPIAQQLLDMCEALVAIRAGASPSATPGLGVGAAVPELLTARAWRLTQMYDRLSGTRSAPMLTTVTPPAAAALGIGDDGTRKRTAAGTATLPSLRVAVVHCLGDADPGNPSDPRRGPVRAVAVVLSDSAADSGATTLFAIADDQHLPCAPLPGVRAVWHGLEGPLLEDVVGHLQAYDPDVIVSWDIDHGGVVQVAARLLATTGADFSARLSRLRPKERLGAAGAAGGGGPGARQDDYRAKEEAEDEEEKKDELYADELADDDDHSDRRHHFRHRREQLSDLVDAGLVSGDRSKREPTGGDGGRSMNAPLRHTAVTVVGRVVLSMRRTVTAELKLRSYTLQSVARRLFGETFPAFADGDLARMLAHTDQQRFAALHHVCAVPALALRVARHLDIFVRTSELARIYGILFAEVLGRGSQFRVESALYRFAKPMGYVLVSPSREQVMQQNRQEGIPLVMEPYSSFYSDPVLVLDFRSLYPSIVSAYNLCYSTVLGKVSPKALVKVGAVAAHRPQRSEFATATFAPNSAMFVHGARRRGVLPQMLDAILRTRFQVQAAMKRAAAAGDEPQRRVLDAQQLGLKLLANVTYGYTAATFSGRMPCSDIADSIVLLARQTLERAVRTVEGRGEWNARVVYGDTDSIFVQLRGGVTKARAFEVAEEMVRAVNAANPAPVTIKFEKVYHPCFMVVKKRYVGYAWETPGQREPKFDAKGLECIRRDQCAATAHLQEVLLRQWFDRPCLRGLRACFYKEASKLQRGDMNPSDVILRSQVKLGSYARDSTLPPGARVALRMMAHCPATRPAFGERVPYIAVRATSGTTQLKDQVAHPLHLLSDGVPGAATGAVLSGAVSREVNATYYIEKHFVPSMQRVFHLVGADFPAWAQAMPRLRRADVLFNEQLVTWAPGRDGTGARAVLPSGGTVATRQLMTEFCQRATCAACEAAEAVTPHNDPPVCQRCLGSERPAALATVAERQRRVEGRVAALRADCDRCAGCVPDPAVAERCRAVECGAVFERRRQAGLLSQLRLLSAYLRWAPRPSDPAAAAPLPPPAGAGPGAGPKGRQQRRNNERRAVGATERALQAMAGSRGANQPVVIDL